MHVFPTVQSSNPPHIWTLRSLVGRVLVYFSSFYFIEFNSLPAGRWLFLNIQSAVTSLSYDGCLLIASLVVRLPATFGQVHNQRHRTSFFLSPAKLRNKIPPVVFSPSDGFFLESRTGESVPMCISPTMFHSLFACLFLCLYAPFSINDIISDKNGGWGLNPSCLAAHKSGWLGFRLTLHQVTLLGRCDFKLLRVGVSGTAVYWWQPDKSFLKDNRLGKRFRVTLNIVAGVLADPSAVFTPTSESQMVNIMARQRACFPTAAHFPITRAFRRPRVVTVRK